MEEKRAICADRQWTLRFGEHVWRHVEDRVLRLPCVLFIPSQDQDRLRLWGDPVFGVHKVVELACQVSGAVWRFPDGMSAIVFLSPSGNLIDHVETQTEEEVRLQLRAIKLSFGQEETRQHSPLEITAWHYLAPLTHDLVLLEWGASFNPGWQHRHTRCVLSDSSCGNVWVFHRTALLHDVLAEEALKRVEILFVNCATNGDDQHSATVAAALMAHGFQLLDTRPGGHNPSALMAYQVWIHHHQV